MSEDRESKGLHEQMKSLEELKRELLGDPNEVFRNAKNEFWDEAKSVKGEKAGTVSEEAVAAAAETVAEEAALVQSAPPVESPAELAATSAIPDPAGIRDLSGNGCEELKRFFDLVDRARYGEYDAYMELGRLAKSDSEYAQSAKRNLAGIKDFLVTSYMEPPTILSMTVMATEKEEINFEKMSTGDLFKLIARDDITHQSRMFSARFVLDGNKKEIAKGAYDVLNSSRNLYSLAAVCGILLTRFGKKAEFLDIEGNRKLCEQKLGIMQQ